MTGKKKQVQANKVKELNESSVKEEQIFKETLLKEDFMEAQV